MTSTEPTAHPGAEVAVELTGSAPADAHAVFGVLHTAYASDRDRGDAPRTPDGSGARPAVWSATFDTADVRDEPRPVGLTAPVTADLQGSYQAVDGLRRTLASAFEVKVLGTSSGDQEEVVQLRLASR
ncbi:hypothetical protein [Streptomyces sp. 8L]|uniref:hypothetical protein n=1 Tax=unclassified Streptomyces TaxID=2593676 RepID=UPI001CD4BBBD|nr:hypothetical protein [Streptomyces sp. 8L]MCA1219304.1 hypothetical protein [Streptomyces sp. 8L]